MTPIGYAGRADELRALLGGRGLAAMAVTNLTNIRWLTGFTGSNALVAVVPDEIVFVTDGRYAERAQAELTSAGVAARIEIGATQPEQQARLLAALGGHSGVGAEAGSLTHARWTAYAAEVRVVPADGLIEDLRRIKDAGEIERIGAAAAAADAALAEVAPLLGSGLSEHDVRTELEYRMRLHGADGASYDTIVASGPEHAARPHHEVSAGPGGRTIVDGDTVVIDVGGLVDGYHSDMTRSYVVGEPSTDQRELYDLLLAVQLEGLAAVRAGVPARDVDAVCRRAIAEAGYAEWILHSTGHGVGLQIHEDPFESPASTLDLRAGDVVTVEPGLYRVGFGGLRIEDLVVVTDAGCQILTHTPKDRPDVPCPPSPPTT